MKLLRAEFVRLLSRRATKAILIAALIVMVSASWSGHSGLSDERAQLSKARADTGGLRSGYVDAYEQNAKEGIERIKRTMSWRNLHAYTMNTFATAHGVALAALLAATFFGAEFRWRYWATLLLHEPRRTRIVFTKLLALWLALAAGLAGVLVLAYLLGMIFSAVFSFGSSGGLPSAGPVALSLLKAWFACTLFGTIAAAGALWFRSSLAGAAVAMGVLIADGLISARFLSLRSISAVQQISSLTDRPRDRIGTVMWFPPIGETDAARGVASIASEASLLTLAIWLVVASVAAVLALRNRDIIE